MKRCHKRAIARADLADFDAMFRDPPEARAIPPCLAGMGCLCAGHARGNPATAKCDTSETWQASGICGAPPGGCGFGPRRRITVTVKPGRTPDCKCGSALIRVKPVVTL